MDNEINALGVDASGNLYAGGVFSGVGSVSANRVARWNGSNWTELGSDNSVNYNVLALAAGGGSVYVGGGFKWAGGVSASAMAQWNGSSWSPVGIGGGMSGSASPNSPVSALVRDASGNVYAGGYFTTAGGVAANYVAKWNGSNWQALGSGMNDGVEALALDTNGNLFAGGNFTTAGGVTANYVAKWNGSNWEALGSGMNNDVAALALDTNGNFYAGGSFTLAGGTRANCIAKWDGNTWLALGSGVSCGNKIGRYYFVSALAVDNLANIYLGGNFSTAGNVTANNIAKWNGSTWSALGSGMDGRVSALVFDGSNNLYAGGAFTTAGGASANNIAKWNGSSWRTLGSGTNAEVDALALDGTGNLYAGGWFNQAGGKESAYFARYAIAPAVSGFTKWGVENKPIAFSASDFASNFSEGSGNALVKVKILSLPDHGTLKLVSSNVSVNQEIAAADLSILSFMPDTEWLGTTSFGWNGSDGNQYAPNGTSVTLTIVLPKYYYFPIMSR